MAFRVSLPCFTRQPPTDADLAPVNLNTLSTTASPTISSSHSGVNMEASLSCVVDGEEWREWSGGSGVEGWRIVQNSNILGYFSVESVDYKGVNLLSTLVEKLSFSGS